MHESVPVHLTIKKDKEEVTRRGRLSLQSFGCSPSSTAMACQSNILFPLSSFPIVLRPNNSRNDKNNNNNKAQPIQGQLSSTLGFHDHYDHLHMSQMVKKTNIAKLECGNSSRSRQRPVCSSSVVTPIHVQVVCMRDFPLPVGFLRNSINRIIWTIDSVLQQQCPIKLNTIIHHCHKGRQLHE